MYISNDPRLRNGSLIEPAMYFAEYPSIEQQQRYRLMGGIAIFFLLVLISIALAVS